MSEPIVYLNGAFVPESEAKVSVFDRCFLYGDGIFEGIAVWNRAPFRLKPHLDRLTRGLRYMMIDEPMDYDGWRRVIGELIERNNLQDGYLRLQISRGEGMSSIKWEKRLLRKPEPNVTIIPFAGFAKYYAGLFGRTDQQGLRAITVPRPRISSHAVPTGMKHCNYLGSVLGAIDVTGRGADIGITVDNDGFVAEGIAYNIFCVVGGKLITPPTERATSCRASRARPSCWSSPRASTAFRVRRSATSTAYHARLRRRSLHLLDARARRAGRTEVAGRQHRHPASPVR
jgi:branched-chain amino acid aminotransferase